MTAINTVAGTIPAESLGKTLVHEHIIASFAGWECDALARPYDREKIVKISMARVGPVKDFGVKSIVDATPIDLGRDIDVMKEVSEKLGINVICSTGMYTEDMGKYAYYRQRNNGKVDNMAKEMCDTFLHEITQGIGKSGIKAGAIKVATGLKMISDCEMATLKAAAWAQKKTGVPIITHTEAGTMGPDQLDILLSEGANPVKIMCGHMCGNPSIPYQETVLKRGTYISFDRFGIEAILPDSTRTATLVSLLKKGYADRIMLSHDCIGCTMGRGGSTLEERDSSLWANWTFTTIFCNILPALKKAGITDRQIETMMVDNPRKLFS
jgi:phosphotriesterase-related protein